MFNWTYKIFLDGKQVDETNLAGLAYIKFEMAKLLGNAELHKECRDYFGNMDNVLSSIER